MTVFHCDASDFVDALPDASVHLILTDPPYFGIVEDSWDNQWPSPGRRFIGSEINEADAASARRRLESQ